MQMMKLNIQMFASSTISETSAPSAGDIRIVWSSTKNDTSNTSSVTAIVQIRKTSGSAWCTFSGNVTIDGTSKSISMYRPQSSPWNTTWKDVGSYTRTITHNADGTKAIIISSNLTQTGTSMAGTYKASGTATLDTINRQSALGNIENFGIDDTITIDITKYVNTFTDNLEVKCGNTTIKSVSNISDGYSLTFSTAEQTAIKNLMSSPQIALTFTLTTLNETTTIGTSVKSAVVTSLDQKVYRHIIKKNNGNYQVSINGFVDTTNSNPLQIFNDDGTLFNDNKVLWSGAKFMHANQSATLSQKVSEQQTGIVLVWSGYSGGSAQDYNFNFTFVPKQYVKLKEGYGVFDIMGGTNGIEAFKYVYVHDDRIVGNSVNTSTSISGYTNTLSVLRYVIGV